VSAADNVVSLDEARVKRALRAVISDLDYDLHKELEADGDYPHVIKEFSYHYLRAVA
jgi:hypothetical protein